MFKSGDLVQFTHATVVRAADDYSAINVPAYAVAYVLSCRNKSISPLHVFRLLYDCRICIFLADKKDQQMMKVLNTRS